MENKFFSYKNTDRLSFMIYKFYDITLNMDIGIFKKGKKLPFAEIDFNEGIMSLGGLDFNLELNIVEDE